MKNVKLETLSKRKATGAFTNKDPRDIVQELKKRHQQGGDFVVDTLKMLYVFEVSELWMGLGRYHAGGNYSAFEKFLQDNKEWMISITLYRRFKQALSEMGEATIRKIGLHAVWHLYRIENELTRQAVLTKMIAQATAIKAPLSDAISRLQVNGKAARRPRRVSDPELREENARLKTRAEMLHEQLEEAKARIAELEIENAELREQLSAARRSSAKTQRKSGKRSTGRGNRSQLTM